MGEITKTDEQPKTKGEYLALRHQRKSLIEQLDLPTKLKRNAEVVAILEVASSKIDRFGWSRMDPHIKDALVKDWLARLSGYDLQEVKAGVEQVFTQAEGKLRTINEHMVEAQILKRRKQILNSLPSDPDPEPERDFSPEAVAKRRACADEILRGFGMTKETSGQPTSATDSASRDISGYTPPESLQDPPEGPDS